VIVSLARTTVKAERGRRAAWTRLGPAAVAGAIAGRADGCAAVRSDGPGDPGAGAGDRGLRPWEDVPSFANSALEGGRSLADATVSRGSRGGGPDPTVGGAAGDVEDPTPWPGRTGLEEAFSGEARRDATDPMPGSRTVDADRPRADRGGSR
jgi:hypothetical protein